MAAGFDDNKFQLILFLFSFKNDIALLFKFNEL